MDGCITKAPSGGEVAGRSPVDRGKQGLKRPLVTDGTGLPLHVVSAGANRHDAPLLGPTLAGLEKLDGLPDEDIQIVDERVNSGWPPIQIDTFQEDRRDSAGYGRCGLARAMLASLADSKSNGDKMVIPLTAAAGKPQPERSSVDLALSRGATILLVEDDAMIAEMLRDRLGSKGHTVWHAATGAEAEAVEQAVALDLIIIDVMLPDANGLILCSELRRRSQAPIIICTASQRPEDAVLGLKLGADDFIRKPFSTDELEARVEAALRRPTLQSQQPAGEDGLRIVGTLVIDTTTCDVAVNGEAVHLTPTEYRLLCALAEHPNHVVPSTELAQQVWGAHDVGIGRSLQVHIRRMRAKLHAGGGHPPAVVAVRGFGYRLVWDRSAPAPDSGTRLSPVPPR